MATGLTDHSQSGEQEILLRWSEGEFGDGVGRLLDIGAADGVTFSNTRALIERGWSAVLVEPAPWAVDKLLALYKDRADVTVVNALVMAERQGLVELAYSRDDLVSTTHPHHRDAWAGQVAYESCWCAAVTLYELLSEFGPFDLASIDAEGETYELLNAYRIHRHWEALRCVCAEVEHPLAEPGLTGWGWHQLALTTNNVVFAR